VVAAPSGGLVAVGFTGAGTTRRPAVWTSANGTQWRLVPPQADFQPSSGVSELSSVTVADGKLLATGKDNRADRAAGDTAVYTSTDGGNTWGRVPATGLDGPGPQTVQRVIRTSGGEFIAVGSALSGAKEGPAIWRSKDGVAWTIWPYLPADATATLYGVTELAGKLITCGSVGSSDRPAVACWIPNEQQRWERWDVAPAADGPKPLLFYGMSPAVDQLMIAGAGQSGSTVDAAFWLATPRT
jgi:hypothetical protein